MITQEIVNGIWNYYLSLERDLDSTSYYVEPAGQENVYSFEFAKLLVLSCTELESVFKLLSEKHNTKSAGNIGEYRAMILHHYPKIIMAEVTISRWGKTIQPFSNWGNGKLFWWDVYGGVKHNRKDNFKQASYKNVVYALSALYVSIFYLAHESDISFSDQESIYIQSEYSSQFIASAPNKKLPDFDEST